MPHILICFIGSDNLIYNVNELINALEKTGITFAINEPMNRHTSFKIGGAADVFAAVSSGEELCKIKELCNTYDVPLTVIGKGSNLLVSDKGIEGVVVTTEPLNKIEVEGIRITAGAGATLSAVCNAAAGADLSGLEFAFGIPGSVGGAVYMNAGAYGGEIKDVIESVTALMPDGNVVTIDNNDLGLSYRKSIFSSNGAVVLSATFCLKQGETEKIREDMNEILRRRKEKQPLEYPSAGSTFKRPEGNFAGTLIEQCGLKGKSVGGASVSRKHAGFVINTGKATAKDVLLLIEKVQNTVFSETGIKLEPEVLFVGRE